MTNSNVQDEKVYYSLLCALGIDLESGITEQEVMDKLIYASWIFWKSYTFLGDDVSDQLWRESAELWNGTKDVNLTSYIDWLNEIYWNDV